MGFVFLTLSSKLGSAVQLYKYGIEICKLLTGTWLAYSGLLSCKTARPREGKPRWPKCNKLLDTAI
jgi:hypothetical protein